MRTHIFLWRRERITLFYSIESAREGLRLVLDDVTARSIEIVNKVPDWIIELEADAVATDHGAAYL
jgi:hypothetical protein